MKPRPAYACPLLHSLDKLLRLRFIEPMSEILSQLYNACDPLSPALPAFYVDCHGSRGSTSFARDFRRHVELGGDNFQTFLFTGHNGCGKSSELKHLQGKLEDPSSRRRYFVVYLDANEYLDEENVAATDVLLAIVSELGAAFREELKIDLHDSYFKRLFGELKGFLTSEIDVSEGELGIGSVKVKVQRLKRDPVNRDNVRQWLRPRTSTILEEIKRLCGQARAELRKRNQYHDFILIVDNLEKIRRFENQEDGLDSHRHLFIDGYTQLTGLGAYVIYTIPLELARSTYGPLLKQRYKDLFILPMVKVFPRGRNDEKFEPGWRTMRKMLDQRTPAGAPDGLFDEDAITFLLRYSGGHARSLMTFVQEACSYVDDPPITLKAAHSAVRQAIRIFSTTIPAAYWPKLARLELSQDQKIDSADMDYATMLMNVVVLEYINGDGSAGPFESAAPWYAVNPIVRELGQFKEALGKAASA